MKLTLNITHDFSDIDDAAAFVATVKTHFGRWFEPSNQIEAPAPRREVAMERPPVLMVADAKPTAAIESAPAADEPVAKRRRGRPSNLPVATLESEPSHAVDSNDRPDDRGVARTAQPAPAAALNDPLPMDGAPLTEPQKAPSAPAAKLPIGNPDFQAVNDALVELIGIADGGHGAAMAVFAKHNAKRLSEVPAEKYIALRDDLVAAKRRLSAADLL